MPRKISNSGIKLIKKFEGCRLSAYQDAVGVITIGYGWTKPIDGNPLTMDTKITQSKAESLLKKGLEAYESKVNKYDAKYRFNQNQFDALVSFAYNIGSIDQLTANGTRSLSAIAEKIPAYNKAGGRILSGLTSRRNAEKQLFLTPVSSSLPSSSREKTKVTYITHRIPGSQWGNEITGYQNNNSMGYSGVFGKPVDKIAIRLNEGTITYTAHRTDGRWGGEIHGYSKTDSSKYAGSSKTPIDAVAIKAKGITGTLKYRVHRISDHKWGNWIKGYSKTNSSKYAGIFGSAIDAIQIGIQ
ncbi:MAG: lysozyme [Eubacterium sp.]|nr:lysozyme [Eubacterium sp.]